MMRELVKQHNTALIFITHDLGVVAEIADEVLVMYRGEALEQGNVRDIFLKPKHPYTKGLLACRPPLDKRYTFLPTVSDFMTIDDKGNCKVPIKKLKGLMGENTTGDIKLEVIAEDTLIEPWQSDFVVETAKKVTVEVKSQKEEKPQIKESTKPQVKVKSVKNYINPINDRT